jgi:hypothetical protein
MWNKSLETITLQTAILYLYWFCKKKSYDIINDSIIQYYYAIIILLHQLISFEIIM